jgi:hypothetical protein
VLSSPAPAPPARRRPRAVTWVAILHFLQALILLPVAALFIVGFTVGEEAGLNELRTAILIYGVLILVYALLALPIAFGLLWLQAWAWTAAMMLQGLQLATSLVQAYFGENDYLTLAMAAFVVLCLNQQEVRVAFGLGRRRDLG